MIFALAAVAALTLSGCATNAEPEAAAETPTPVVTETATPDPVATPGPTEVPAPVETADAEAVEAEASEEVWGEVPVCDEGVVKPTDECTLHPNDQPQPPEGFCAELEQPEVNEYGYADGVDYLGGRPVPVIADSGARDGANGSVSTDAEGNPAAYVVAQGDTLGAIAERFCTDTTYLTQVNLVRRQTPAMSDVPEMPLFAGDTLNLSAYTVTSVGDQNGQVYDFNPDFQFPPQR